MIVKSSGPVKYPRVEVSDKRHAFLTKTAKKEKKSLKSLVEEALTTHFGK